MVLRQGDSGEPVKKLQRGLNKLGEMLLVDGDFGPSTRHAVVGARETLGKPGPPEADDAFQRAVTAAPDPFPPLTAAGVTFIAREEVSDAPTYRRRYQTPCLPPAPSGVTIGIGYDCQFSKRADFEADWADVLPATMIDLLRPTLGKAGTPELHARTLGVLVPLGLAMRVFATRSLPKYFEQARRIYPEIADDSLTAAQRTALVSLVYNRGTDLAGERRREMKAIRTLLAAGDLDKIDEQFDSMVRLWSESAAPGLIRRRRAEAKLWRSGFASLQLE